jgi:hypothetical protein
MLPAASGPGSPHPGAGRKRSHNASLADSPVLTAPTHEQTPQLLKASDLGIEYSNSSIHGFPFSTSLSDPCWDRSALSNMETTKRRFSLRTFLPGSGWQLAPSSGEPG